MSKIELRGPGGWVWYVEANGGPAGIAAKARMASLTWLVIKGGDGPARWDQLTPDLVAELRTALPGVAILAWYYGYGGRRPDTPHGDADWTVDDEIAVSQAIVRETPGLAGVVLDAEAEYEGRPAEAHRYATALRAACDEAGILFAYAPLPVIDYHTALPYVQLNRACDLVMPQFYSRALGPQWPASTLFTVWQRWATTWASWGMPMPALAPVGECFGEADPDDVRAFALACQASGAAAWSFWSLDEFDNAEAAAIAESAPDPAASTAAAALRERLMPAFDGAWQATEQAAAAIVEVQRQIARIKEEVGR